MPLIFYMNLIFIRSVLSPNSLLTFQFTQKMYFVITIKNTRSKSPGSRQERCVTILSHDQEQSFCPKGEPGFEVLKISIFDHFRIFIFFFLPWEVMYNNNQLWAYQNISALLNNIFHIQAAFTYVGSSFEGISAL